MFRPAAVAKLHAGGEGGKEMVSPLNWLAVAAIGVLVIGVVLWLFLGSIEHLADGRGVIIRDSEFGIVEVAALEPGRIENVLVRTGDIVEPGQAVATMDMTSVRDQIALSERLLAGLRQAPGKDEARTQRILDLETQVTGLQRRLANEGVIRSARGGRVIEVVASPGSVTAASRTLLRVESSAGAYEALVYVSAMEGKKIKPGMLVRVVPSTLRAHEHGHLLGRVSMVSTYPVTADYLSSELGGNKQLVSYLLENGSSIEVCVDLPRDPSTGEYRWSSPKGATTPVESGLLVDAFVVVDKLRPIQVLLPSWK